MRESVTGTAIALILALSSGLARVSEAQPPDRVRVLIGFRQSPQAAEAALVRGVGGDVRYVYHLVPAVAATVPVTALRGLSRNPMVSLIEADGVVEAIDAELDSVWGVARIGSGTAHASAHIGSGVKVGIVDTGIDYNHPDLSGNYGGGWDFANDDNDPMDDHGHGTHVAGTVAALDNNTGVVGVAPGAIVSAIKVLSASGSGSWSDIIAGIEWATDNGIQVTNNSYGGTSHPGTLVQQAFDNSYAAGVLHIAANGNSGTCAGTGDTAGYPAKFASVVGVAATDVNDNRACFSSTGPATELAAPGVSIYSTRRTGGYTTMSGTSMASPHAAGVAALVFGTGIMDPVVVRQRLVDTADDLGAAGHDTLFGFGLVDAAGAVDFGAPVNEPPSVTVTSPADGSQYDAGTSVAFTGAASDQEDGDLTAAISWTSHIDGALGTGGGVASVLSNGVHVVTASVADSGGRSSSDSVQVIVSAPSSQTAHVTSVAYAGRGGKNQDKHLEVIVTVKDEAGYPVSSATVNVSILETVSQTVTSATGVTDGSGVVTFGLNNAASGCYQTLVTDLSSQGLTWDQITPVNQYCK